MKKHMTFRVLTALGVMLAVALTACPAQGAAIIWVTDNTDASSAPSPDDIGFRNMLVANGHTVDRRTGAPWRALSTAEKNDLNNADLVIVSRDADSGQYDDSGELAAWNGVTSPMMLLNQYFVRSSRWKWLNNGGTSGTGDGIVEVPAAATGHDIFQNVTLDGNNRVDIATSSTPAAGTANVGNGQSLAFDPDNSNRAAIVYWDKGTEYYSGSGQTAGDKRMFFGAGLDGNNPKGGYNLTAAGEHIFLDAVDFMASVTLITSTPINKTWSDGVYWSDGKAAHAGVHYNVGDHPVGKSLRTPNNANNPTFPGDSLTIHSTGALGFKHNGTVTINDLRLDGGTINASSGNRTMGLGGNLHVASDSTINLSNSGDTRDIELKSTLTGSGNLIVKGDSSYSILRFRSNTAGYTGAIVVEDSVDRLHMGHTAGNVTTVKGVGAGLDYGPFEEFDVGTVGGNASVVCPAGQPVDLGTGGGSLGVARQWSGDANTTGLLDLSGASDVDINVTNLRMGIITSGSNSSAEGTLKLSAAGPNTVKATTITLGDSTASGNTGVTNTLTLGGADNDLWADTMYVGRRKSKGRIDILPGGSVVLRNKAGTERANVRVGLNDVNSGTRDFGEIDLSGADDFNAMIGSLIVGQKTGGGSGKAVGRLTLAESNTIDATTIVMGNSDNGGQTGSSDQQQIILGNTNTIKTDTFTISNRKSNALVAFGAPGGTLNLTGSAGARTDLRVGYNSNTGSNATGMLDLADGTFNADLSDLTLGNMTGSNMDGSGTGTVKHAAGTVDVSNGVHLGNTTKSTGRYELGGTGVLNVTQNIEVGNYGAGVFTQTGGQLSVNGELQIAQNAGATGTYNLTGGRLSADVIRLGAGTAAFNFTGGAIAPGDSVGTTEFYGAFDQGIGGALEIEIDGPNAGQYDVLKVFGSVTLAGDLDLFGAYKAEYLDSYVILENDGTDAITGIFAGLPEGHVWREDTLGSMVRITYRGGTDSNDVVVTAIPEPMTMLAVGLGISSLGGYVRKRRRA